MLTFDRENYYFENGCSLVCGLDEVGRGPLVGPVVAAVVFIDKEKVKFITTCPELKYIKDSKKLSEKKREEMFDFIQKNFLHIGIGICDHETIDRINILQATFLAMKKALSSIKAKPDIALIDGSFIIPNSSLKQEAIIKGDGSVPLIAAASIIAKVTRDKIMNEMHQQYPMYSFDKHKGYGTKIHLEAIAKYGPCPFHRKSFKPISNYFND